ncbi:Bud site selection protein bud4 [Thecaphora frezii]
MSMGDAGPVFTTAHSPLLTPEQLEESSKESAKGVELEELPTCQSIRADLARSKAMLDISLQRAIDSGFSTNLERENSCIYQPGQVTKVQGPHTSTASDVDSSKMWQKLWHPSNMNKYVHELHKYWQNENPKCDPGKVFVMAAELAVQATHAEPMLAYINWEGALGQASIIFEKVAVSCHGKCLMLELPIYGISNLVQSLSGPSSLAG